MSHHAQKGHKRSNTESPAAESTDEVKKFASPAPKKTKKAAKQSTAPSTPSFITQSPRTTGSRPSSVSNTPSRTVTSESVARGTPVPASTTNSTASNTTLHGSRKSTETSVVALPTLPHTTDSHEDPQEEIFSPHGHGPHKVTLTKKTTHTRSWTETIFSPMFAFWPFQAEDKDKDVAKEEGASDEPRPHAHREVINYESSSDEEEVEEHDGNKTTKKLIIHKTLSSDEILSESSDGEEGEEEEGQMVVPHPQQQHHVKVNDETTLEYTIEDTEEPFNPYLFIRNLPPSTLESGVALAALPPKPDDAPKITLVLDLDETLVHCSIEALADADYSFPVLFNDREYMVHARRRPHFERFIRRMSELFEIVVFTASQKVYASKLLGIIDPNNFIKHKLYRDACCCVEGNYLKDLRILGRDLAHVIIIDNSPQAFGYQVDNGIPIESWFEDRADRELLELIPFLEALSDVDDVRPHIRDRFKLYELIAQAG